MAYSVSAISSLTDIPDLLATFADQLGFTVGNSGDSVTVRHPVYSGAKIFTVGALLEGTGRSRRERLAVDINAADANTATAESPKLNPSGGNTDDSIVIVQPTALHLFGELHGDEDDAGGTFIAGVIEYGFNLYRHIYLGYVEKITPFGGGEVITGSSQGVNTLAASSDIWTHITYGESKLPFSAVNSNSSENGGLHIDHPGASQPWYTFNTGTNPGNTIEASISTANRNRVVIGGYRDSINSGYLTAAQSPYSGAQISVPINLYIGRGEGSQQLFQPVGAPAGVRMVNMENLEPGAQITIGSSVWRVFPIFAKSDDDTLISAGALGASSNYRFAVNNTSHYVGMAYRVSE